MVNLITIPEEIWNVGREPVMGWNLDQLQNSIVLNLDSNICPPLMRIIGSQSIKRVPKKSSQFLYHDLICPCNGNTNYRYKSLKLTAPRDFICQLQERVQSMADKNHVK
jgi:hypothetical protein